MSSTNRSPDVIEMPDAAPIRMEAGKRIGHASVAKARRPSPQPQEPKINPNGAARYGPTLPTHAWAGTIAAIAMRKTTPVTSTATEAIAGRNSTGKRPNANEGSPNTPSAVGATTRQNIDRAP